MHQLGDMGNECLNPQPLALGRVTPQGDSLLRTFSHAHPAAHAGGAIEAGECIICRNGLEPGRVNAGTTAGAPIGIHLGGLGGRSQHRRAALVGLLIAAVLYINEFQDATADASAGKVQVVVRLGRERAAWGYLFLILLTYVSISLAALFRVTSPFTLVALATLPVGVRAVQVARAHYDDHVKLIPANAATVFIHLVTGLLLSAGYLLDKALRPFI